MIKLITSAEDSDDLSIGFDRSREKRKQELTDNKNKKGKYHLRIMLEDVFSCAEHQEKTTCGLGYKLTITRIKDDAVIDKVAAITDARKTKWNISNGTYPIIYFQCKSKVFCLNNF